METVIIVFSQKVAFCFYFLKKLQVNLLISSIQLGGIEFFKIGTLRGNVNTGNDACAPLTMGKKVQNKKVF